MTAGTKDKKEVGSMSREHHQLRGRAVFNQTHFCCLKAMPKSTPDSSLKLLRKSSRWLWWWLSRVVFVGTVVYGSVMIYWSAKSIGTFTPIIQDSWLRNNSLRHHWDLAAGSCSGVDNDSMKLSTIVDFPSGEVMSRDLRCIGWRATGNCSPSGPRQPKNDRRCVEKVSNGESGYCEVEDAASGERFKVMQRHCNSIRRGVPFRCSDAQKFIDFRIQMSSKIKEVLAPNFTLPNFEKTENASRDGIVMVVYPKLLASAYATIRVLRDVLDCQLPIEIWFQPDEMKLHDERFAPLRRLASNKFNITIQEINDPQAKRYLAKVHAIYHSFFDRVLFLDADNVPVRDPSFLFESPEIVKTGAMFWPDFWHPGCTIFNIHAKSLLWEFLDMSFVDMFEQESGQLVVDRRRHAGPLELVQFFAFHRPDLLSSLKLVWGDKDLFRLAWLKLIVPFSMIQAPPDMAGIVLNSSKFCGMTMAQHDTDGEVLFLHRNHQKLTGIGEAKVHHDNYPDAVIWTHLLRFRKGSKPKDYVVQPFWADVGFQKKHRCYGRHDAFHSSTFYVQNITGLFFSSLETHLRRFALESTSLPRNV